MTEGGTMRLGFIGTGTITTAMVTGLCTAAETPEHILVSPRNAERAAGLAEAFTQVAVAKDNQEVIDGSDWCSSPCSRKWRKRCCRTCGFVPASASSA